jgi:hypothetical protein
VPRRAIALIARCVYNENYVALPTSHVIRGKDGAGIKTVEYAWRFRGAESSIEVVARSAPEPLVEGSEEEFIVQHHWGYVSQRDGGTAEYRVEHPPWRVWQCESSRLEGDVESLYGSELARTLASAPSSALLAEGSAVVVHRSRKVA